MAGVLKVAGTIFTSGVPVFSSSVLCVLCCSSLKYPVLRFGFVGLRPVSYVPHISSTTGLFILDCPFDFLGRVFHY
jgi:hypothetical protein